MRSTALPFLPDRSRALALGIRAALLCLPLIRIAPGLPRLDRLALPSRRRRSRSPPARPTQQAVRSYDIPAGPLSSALSRFAGEAGVLLSVDGSLLQGLETNGLRGSTASTTVLPHCCRAAASP